MVKKKKIERVKQILDYSVYIGTGLEFFVTAFTYLGYVTSLISVGYLIGMNLVVSGSVGLIFIVMKYYERIIYNMAAVHMHAKKAIWRRPK